MFDGFKLGVGVEVEVGGKVGGFSGEEAGHVTGVFRDVSVEVFFEHGFQCVVFGTVMAVVQVECSVAGVVCDGCTVAHTVRVSVRVLNKCSIGLADGWLVYW